MTNGMSGSGKTGPASGDADASAIWSLGCHESSGGGFGYCRMGFGGSLR